MAKPLFPGNLSQIKEWSDAAPALARTLVSYFNILNAGITDQNFGLRAMAVPIAGVIIYTAAQIPTGFLACDGSEINRTTYSDLYNIIRDSFGAPQSQNNFVLPNIPSPGSGLTYIMRVLYWRQMIQIAH